MENKLQKILKILLGLLLLINIAGTVKSQTANAGPDQIICSSTVILNATAPQAGESGYWTTNTPGLSFTDTKSYNSTVKFLPLGATIFTWTVTNGNTSASDNVVITNNNPTIPNAGTNISVCTNTAVLSANQIFVGSSGWFTNQPGVFFSTPSAYNTTVNNLASGANVLEWRAQNGSCVLSSFVTIENKSVTAIAAPDIVSCYSVVSLMATIPTTGTGYWTKLAGGGIIQKPAIYNTLVTNLSKGINKFRWNVVNDPCMASDDLIITYDSLTVNAGADKLTCYPEAGLSADPLNAEETGFWSAINNPGIFTNPTSNVTGVTNLLPGVNKLKWTVRKNGCDIFDEINVGYVKAIAGPDALICTQDFIAQGNIPLPGVNGVWELFSGGGIFVNSANYNTLIKNVPVGQNVYVWKMNYNNCNSADTVRITGNSEIGFNTNITNTYTVNFNSLGIGLANFHWDFGDGSVSEIANPVHTYVKDGIYKVCFTAKTLTGCVLSKCKTIVVGNISCNASFNFGIQGLNVSFTNTSIGNITNFFWNFGDGVVDSVPNPVHLYKSPGTYTVCLSVINKIDSCVDRACYQINVGEIKCNADFNVFVTTNTLEAAFINNSLGNISKVFWNFGDGTTSTVKNPIHKYTKVGMYPVELSVSNDSSTCFDRIVKNIQVGTVQCFAEFNFFINNQTQTVSFQNQSFPKSNTRTYWEFGNGFYSTLQDPVYKYPKAGSYMTRLTIKDTLSNCVSTVQKPILIGLVSCSAEFKYFVDSITNVVQFINDPALPEGTKLHWDFGDGTWADIKNPQHFYQFPRYYQVTLNTFNQQLNCNNHFTTPILVGAPGKDCFAEFVYQVDSLTRNVIFTDNSSGKINNWYWNFGDGTYSNIQNPEHKYAKPGIYNVCLKIVNSDGNSRFVCHPVQVAAVPCMADFSFSVDSVTNTVKFTDLSIGSPNLWKWDFADGSASTIQNPEHQYGIGKSYMVHLEIKNSLTGCISHSFDIVNIDTASTGLQAGFGATAGQSNSKPSHPVDFYGRSRGNASSASWNFGDGTSQKGEADYVTYNPTHIYASAGQYYACFTVSDAISGESDTYCEWVTAIEATTVITDPVSNIKNTHIYPNPAKDYFVIEYNLNYTANVQFIISDQLGRVVYNETAKNISSGYAVQTINTSEFNQGMYFLQINDGKFRYNHRIIIIR